MAATVNGFVTTTFQTVPAGGSVSVPYTTVAGTDGLLLMVAARQFAALSTLSITFDGVALTQVGPVVNDTVGFCQCAFYRLDAPPITTANIVFSSTHTGDNYVWFQPCCTHGTSSDVIDVASILSDASGTYPTSQSVALSVPSGKMSVGFVWGQGGGTNNYTWDNSGVFGASGSNSGRLLRSAYMAGAASSFGYVSDASVDHPVLMAVLLAEVGGATAQPPVSDTAVTAPDPKAAVGANARPPVSDIAFVSYDPKAIVSAYAFPAVSNTTLLAYDPARVGPPPTPGGNNGVNGPGVSGIGVNGIGVNGLGISEAA